MQPTAVDNARQAISVLRQSHRAGARMSLVLSDVNMPDVDGFKLTSTRLLPDHSKWTYTGRPTDTKPSKQPKTWRQLWQNEKNKQTIALVA